MKKEQRKEKEEYFERFLERDRITPLMSNREESFSDYSKTKKCRVSKML